jgi:hypothetical protein
MELILLGITVVSLVVTVVMSVAVWRLNRTERARSDARVAALNAAVGEDPLPLPASAAQPRSVAAAAPAAEPVAVNESRSTPPWATPKVSTLVAPKARGSDVVIRPALTGGEFPVEKSPLSDTFLGGSGAPAPGDDRQKGLAIAAALLFVIVLTGGYWTVFGSRTPVASAATVAAAPAPLELVSLRHERRGGRLAVSGLVRNPSSGLRVSKLTAVVFLFDKQGGFISSAKSDIDFVTLSPGDESPFVIAVDAPATVARYRVSFRTDSGVVPHVDRRGQEPIAQGTVAREGA